MNSSIWLALFAASFVTTAVGLARLEAEVTGYAGAMTTVISMLLSYGAMNFEVASGGTTIAFRHPGVALLFFVQVIVGILIIIVGVYDWYAEEQERTETGTDVPDEVTDPADIPKELQ